MQEGGVRIASFYVNGLRVHVPFSVWECGVSVEDNIVKPCTSTHSHRLPSMAFIGSRFISFAFLLFDFQAGRLYQMALLVYRPLLLFDYGPEY
ncbi:hypothetical protein GWK47_013552 [Chionoecetes opilio]|uniref:Uncharacterized protein n=1 Tax=Chionoecetes opilio TaxID=41210 RepID=A0A8J4XVD5_CHIOP|nr:hypothetical protein GWK47_013552 [Chionoecetes opilio]